jgi:hypothetical protein
MRRSAKQTAVLLVVILTRSGQTRARVSAKTLRILSGRTDLRVAFIQQVTSEIADFGWIMGELDNGGYGVINAKTLEAAKSVTVKKLLNFDERKAIKAGTVSWEVFEAEASPAEDDSSPDEDD